MVEVHPSFAAEAHAHPVEQQVNNRGGVESQHLAHNQPANNGDSQRPSQLGTGARSESQWQRTEHGRRRRHENGAEAQLAGFKDGVARSLPVFALRYKSKVDHHDRVLFDDADQQNDADDRDHVEVDLEQHQRKHRSNAG